MKFQIDYISQKVGVVIFTCYHMIIFKQNHFLEHVNKTILITRMVTGSRHHHHCLTQKISDQTNQK